MVAFLTLKTLQGTVKMPLVKMLYIILFTLLVSSCAMPTTNEISRKHYGDWEKEIGYTQVVQVGKHLYISGVVSEGKNIEEQVHGVYKRIQSILADYNTNTGRVVKEILFTKDMELMKSAVPIRKQYFPTGEYPAAPWVQIDRLYLTDFLVEVDVEVILP